MAKFSSVNMLRNGPSHLKTNGSKMLLLSGYTFGDSYATVLANAIAEEDMVTGDYVFSTVSDDEVLTFGGGKSAVASAGSGATPNLHIAFTDGTSELIYVTDETSDQVVTSGNTVNFPELTYTSNQPT